MMFLGLRKLGNICCGHKMFQNKIRNISCVPVTKFVSATNVARAGKQEKTFVSATMYPQQCVLVCQGLNVKCLVTEKALKSRSLFSLETAPNIHEKVHTLFFVKLNPDFSSCVLEESIRQL